MPGSLSWGFDTNFRMTSQTVNGTALAFGYDLDGLLTGAGALTLTLETRNGRRGKLPRNRRSARALPVVDVSR